MNTKLTNQDDSALEMRLHSYFAERKAESTPDRSVCDRIINQSRQKVSSPYIKYFSFSYSTIKVASVIAAFIVVIGATSMLRKDVQPIAVSTGGPVSVFSPDAEPITVEEVESLALESDYDEIDTLLDDEQYSDGDEALYL